MSKIKLLLAEDCSIVRKSLRSLLDGEEDIEVIETEAPKDRVRGSY